MKTQSDYKKFDDVVKKLLTVSHEEMKKREKEWKRQKAKKKRAIA